MSLERALGIIDSLLEVLDEADKRHTHTKETCPKEESKEEKTAEKVVTTSAPAKPFAYFTSLDEIEESQLVQITSDLAFLQEKWKTAGLAENDELKEFCNQVGKVVEIESSDDTLQIQWENYDTCWVPAFACGRASSGAKATIPGTNNSWLNEGQAVGAEFEEEQQNTNEENDDRYLPNAEDPAVIVGNTVRVTKDLPFLEERWKAADLEKNDKISAFLGAVGTIKEINEDNDSVKLQWKNEKEDWIPVQACLDGRNAEPTSV